MTSTRKIFLVAFFLFAFSALQAQVPDTGFVMYQKDSAIIPETNATIIFFQENERLTAAQSAKTFIVTKSRRTLSLAKFRKEANLLSADIVLADLDNDGKKELLMYNFTGGAHCCDEIYIFKNIAPDKYQYVVKMFGGHTVINAANELEFTFTESFGYFFTCYGCRYADTTDGAPLFLDRITLKYNKGKCTVVPGDTELKSIINDNLAKLGEQPYEKLADEPAMDEGLRKEVAINLVIFYYSFGRNLTETQKLFNKYYKHPDAKKVWDVFTKNLGDIKKGNDF